MRLSHSAGVRGWFGAALALALWSPSARAVLFYETADPTYNTQPPTGPLLGSGWDSQGQWGGFLGTAIAPRYFLTARHIGGQAGDTFRFAGKSYRTVTNAFDDPGSDLRLWRVCGVFPRYAPLYTNADETGRGLVAFGRGTQRGNPFYVTNHTRAELRGWHWGIGDGLQRWGSNTVVGITPGPSTLGDFLRATFDAGAGPDECHLSTGDSGGAVFLEDSGTWKLAGINYAVDGYRRTFDGPDLTDLVLFDERGLFEDDGSGTNWVEIPLQGPVSPGSFYATRTSARLAWIRSVLEQPLPPEEQIRLETAAAVDGPFLEDAEAVVDEDRRTVTARRSEGAQFYRVRCCAALRISSLQLETDTVVLAFE